MTEQRGRSKTGLETQTKGQNHVGKVELESREEKTEVPLLKKINKNKNKKRRGRNVCGVGTKRVRQVEAAIIDSKKAYVNTKIGLEEKRKHNFTFALIS